MKKTGPGTLHDCICSWQGQKQKWKQTGAFKRNERKKRVINEQTWSHSKVREEVQTFPKCKLKITCEAAASGQKCQFMVYKSEVRPFSSKLPRACSLWLSLSGIGEAFCMVSCVRYWVQWKLPPVLLQRRYLVVQKLFTRMSSREEAAFSVALIPRRSGKKIVPQSRWSLMHLESAFTAQSWCQVYLPC